MKKLLLLSIGLMHIFFRTDLIGQENKAIQWPDGNTVAISLTWDDARDSQVLVGTPILDKYEVKATFYVVPFSVERELESWKSAVLNGHEIGNHTLLHPCSESYSWSRENAIEDYSLNRMRNELIKANVEIEKLLGVTPTEFAYPCGNTLLGRDKKIKSYVPVVRKLFSTGRAYDDISSNDLDLDPARLSCVIMDDRDFNSIKSQIEESRKQGKWLILGGHEIGSKETNIGLLTNTEMLEELLDYIKNPANKIWAAPVGEIASYIRANKKTLVR
tara:strand:+ start:205 stop:1026 length:822 start_codon:yes stop_codon:yes gene_type:complete